MIVKPVEERKAEVLNYSDPGFNLLLVVAMAIQ